MHQEGIVTKPRKKFCITTDSKHADPIAPNVLNREFAAELPNTAWVTDVTYVWTLQGWLYLPAILDLCSRRVVGWATSSHNDRELALDALGCARRQGCAKCDEERMLQRAALQPGSEAAPASVSQVLAQSGQPLTAGTRAFMESRFRADFSSVRIHDDARAQRSAADMYARAYTVGNDVVFAAGEYAQIQTYLGPAILNEVEIPRATKRSIDDTACQPEAVPAGFADLYRRSGGVHEIAEIKPIRNDMGFAVQETDHYRSRAAQSVDRISAARQLCPGQTESTDDRAFARRVRIDRTFPRFGRLVGILTTDTVIGAFDSDNTKTLKARLHAPGAVGYWCTGGASDTYTCGVSEAETQAYIDRVAQDPAQAVLDEFLRDEIERPLERALEARSVADVLAEGERRFGAVIRAQLRPLLGPLAEQFISQASAQQLGRLIEDALGPEARSIITTWFRRFVNLFVPELRTALRNALSGLIREALLALCIGAPAVTLEALIERLRTLLKDASRKLMPVVATAVAMQLVTALRSELAAMLSRVVEAIGRAAAVLGDALLAVGRVLLRALAAIVIAILAAGVLVLGILSVLTLFDPVPGDEVLLGGATAALARLIPLLGRYVLSGSTEEPTDGA